MTVFSSILLLNCDIEVTIVLKSRYNLGESFMVWETMITRNQNAFKIDGRGKSLKDFRVSKQFLMLNN